MIRNKLPAIALLIYISLSSALYAAENKLAESINLAFIGVTNDSEKQHYYDLAAAYYAQKRNYEVITGVKSFQDIRERLQTISSDAFIADLIIVSHGSERKGVSLPFYQSSTTQHVFPMNKLDLKIQQIKIMACGVGRQQKNLTQINDYFSEFIQEPPKVTTNKGYQVFWFSQASQKVLSKQHDYLEFMITPNYNWQSERHIAFVQQALQGQFSNSKQAIKRWFQNQRNFEADQFIIINDFEYVVKAYNQDLKLAGSVDKYLKVHPVFNTFKKNYTTFGKIEYKLDKTDNQFTNIAIPMSSVKVFF
jgi:hypothetical protein